MTVISRGKVIFARVAVITAALVLFLAFGDIWSPHAKQTYSLATMPRLAATPLPSDEGETLSRIRFVSERVKRDPEDFVAQNMLASYFLQRVRETSNVDYLRLAKTAARASLASVPAQRNAGGVSALAHAEFAEHEFIQAREHATLLTQLEPGKGSSWAMLGDALLELGDYDGAAEAFHRMQRCGFTATATNTRLARLALLRGDALAAHHLLVQALAFALDAPAPPRETVAWCYWQLGETAFSVGEYVAAEENYRAALTAFPEYVNALPSLGRVRAARGDLRESIEHYEHAVRILPDPTFVAALGDLYRLVNRRREAESRYELVEQIGRLSVANGAASNRQLILFRADHDVKVQEAYHDAVQEYRLRRDIYGEDALAWSALKAGKLTDAQEAMKSALRLGTQDSRLFYHAGMIARATGDGVSSRRYLEHALALNPRFDPLQAERAKTELGR